jgi:hypothetical protein
VGKAKRTKTKQRSRPSRRIVVISALEIGNKDAMVTLRGGLSDHHSTPLRIAMPGKYFGPVLDMLHTAVRDAEEQYWDLVIPMVRRLGEDPDELEVEALLNEWLRKQNWQAAVRAAPNQRPGEPFAVINAGHVGLALDPPFTPSPVLAIFDPLQLRRTEPKMRTAIAGALASPPTAPWSLEQSVRDVLRFLREQPWLPDAVPGPRKEEAAESLQAMRADFLAREPFIRPKENNLDVGTGADSEEPDESAFDDDADNDGDDDCPRCEASRMIGGILCVCGHDWSCHDGSPAESEPCSHCSCEDMRAPGDPPAT